MPIRYRRTEDIAFLPNNVALEQRFSTRGTWTPRGTKRNLLL